MIREFQVENFLSIKDNQKLDFVTKGPASEIVAEVVDGLFLYKLGILYGPNASGKSNILCAIDVVFQMLIVPFADSTKRIPHYLPFMQLSGRPTKMFVSFYVDGIRYDYKIEYNQNYILREELNYYPNGSKSLFYERTFVGENVQADIKFGLSLKLSGKTKDTIRDNTLNNHSVLSVCRKIAPKDDMILMVKLYSQILAKYHNVDGDDKRGIVEMLSETSRNPKKKYFFNLMLQKADLNIIDFYPVTIDRHVPFSLKNLVNKNDIPDDVKAKLLKSTKESIIFVNKSDSGHFNIPIKLQSKGTLKYLNILSVLYDMITDNHVYPLDELGEDLHSDLLYYYINVFLYNSEKSQLIISSQDTSLLSQELFNDNRGAIWFVDKNPETAASEYSRGDSFGLHRNNSLFNSYSIGRMGAKPELGSIFIDLDMSDNGETKE